jgi:polyisoprenoid-binding protein YceI
MGHNVGGRALSVQAGVIRARIAPVVSAVGGLAILALSCLILFLASTPAFAQLEDFKIDPQKTTVKFTLDAVLHKVDGTFQLKPSVLQFDPGSGRISGEIFVDARSGATGNTMRDRKMHKDVLESDRFPDIQFDPDLVTGTVARAGKSSVMVHGTFRIHGAGREITVPAVVEMAPDSWSATIHFTIPYEKWGMKNPSNLFLHVSDSVEIDLALAGTVEPHSGGAHASAH